MAHPHEPAARPLAGVLATTARLARGAEYATSVLVPRQPDIEAEARAAAERAGVDVYWEVREQHLAVRFVARHQDRLATPTGPLARETLVVSERVDVDAAPHGQGVAPATGESLVRSEPADRRHA